MRKTRRRCVGAAAGFFSTIIIQTTTLTSRPGTIPELLISPKSLLADENQFENSQPATEEHMEDPLLELLRGGSSLQREQFLAELHRQRNSEALASS